MIDMYTANGRREIQSVSEYIHIYHNQKSVDNV